MSFSFKTSLITTAETLPLRQRVLKPFMSEAECVNPGDELDSTFHFGLSVENKVVCVATFIAEYYPDFRSEKSYRLRGMATDEKLRGQGLGQILLSHGIDFLKLRDCDFIWCNARIKAFSFYEKLGFKTHGPLFELKGIGPHKVMYKYLIPR